MRKIGPEALIAVSLVFSQSTAGAQDGRNYLRAEEIVRSVESPSAVFAAVGKVRYAVRTEGDFELGYYYDAGDEEHVNFHVCPEGEPLIRVHRRKLKAAGDTDCASLPGRPRPPFSAAIAAYEWSYDPSREGFTISGWESPKTTTFLPCEATPDAVLSAALQDTSRGAWAVGANEITLGAVAEALNTEFMSVTAPHTATLERCAEANRFWTVPIGGFPDAADVEVLGVTNQRPFANW